MNKTKLILITLVIIFVSLFILYGIRLSVQNELVLEEPFYPIEEEITSTNAVYISEMGDEAHVDYFSDDTALLTIIGNDEYKDIQFTHATSASGARYENIDKGLILWEKEPELTIYKNDEQLFFGKKIEAITKDQILKLLPNTTWVWIKTYNDIGPAIQNSSVVVPVKKDVFTLMFNSDGKISGTTDCNSFSGTYSIDEYNKIRFGSFMSTLMFCENSQEQEFISMLKDSSIFITEDELILEHDQTVYFKKQ
jgi:membrane-bound inhibitor of C-type lysozyme